jgi:murein L,D-transpeptidase YcbB/YkuD
VADRSTKTHVWLAFCLAGLTACQGSEPVPPKGVAPSTATTTTRPTAATSEDLVATVDRLLESGEHPGLAWTAIEDVMPTLEELYRAEPDRLFWFDGDEPVPATRAVLGDVALAGEHGLDVNDYDAVALAHQWAAHDADALSAPERALFDTGLTVAVARLIAAVHLGRIDPTTMHWGYEEVTKPLDVAERLREVRQGKPLRALLSELEPPFDHYARARQTLAEYKRLAAAGEPDTVPDLPDGTMNVEPGDAWAGVPALAARLRALGDLPAA